MFHFKGKALKKKKILCAKNKVMCVCVVLVLFLSIVLKKRWKKQIFPNKNHQKKNY